MFSLPMVQNQAVGTGVVRERGHAPINDPTSACIRDLQRVASLTYHGRTRSLFIHFGRPLYLFSLMAIGGALSPSSAYNSRVIPSATGLSVIYAIPNIVHYTYLVAFRPPSASCVVWAALLRANPACREHRPRPYWQFDRSGDLPRYDTRAVSYTHLTLPTICSV